MSSPTVSIIIPVYNRPALLREAVASALAQTWRPIEILIVDDGSTDDTPAVIAELARSHDVIRALHRPNGGPGAARETGRLAARGEFLQYLDSDDLLLPSKLELQVTALLREPAAAIAYGRTTYRNAEGNVIPCTWKPSLDGQTQIFPHFLLGRLWETATPLYRASVASEVGPWSTLRLEEDWEYDCRYGALGAQLVHVATIVAEHRDLAADRLSRGRVTDPYRLSQRAAAHAAIYRSARRAEITNEQPEMQQYARELFLLARQCGAAGNAADSRMLLALAAEASSARDIRFYERVSRTIGSRAVGTLSSWIDRFRRDPSPTARRLDND